MRSGLLFIVVLCAACPPGGEGEGDVDVGEGEGEGEQGDGEGESGDGEGETSEGEGDVDDAPGVDLGLVVTGSRVILEGGPRCNAAAGDERDCVYGCIDSLVLVVDGDRRAGRFGIDNELVVDDAAGWQDAADVAVEIGGCGDGVVTLPLAPQPSPRLTTRLALDDDRAVLEADVDDGFVADCVAENGDLFGFFCGALTAPIPLPRVDEANDDGAERFVEARRALPGLTTSPIGPVSAELRGDSARADFAVDVVDAGAATVRARASAFEPETIVTVTRDGGVPVGLAVGGATVVKSGDGTDVDFGGGAVHVDADIAGVVVAGVIGGSVVSYDSGDLAGGRVVVDTRFSFVERP